MTVDRVTYQKIFPTGMMYLNHKIGVEIQVSEGESPDEAFALAKKTVEQWNLESNPGMAAAMEFHGIVASANGDYSPTVNIDPMERRVGLLVGDINSCEDVKVLESYRLLVKKAPELQAAYEKKYKELSKKK